MPLNTSLPIRNAPEWIRFLSPEFRSGEAATTLRLGVSACSSESTGGTDPQTTTKEQQQLGTVQASAATKALGIAVWRTDATSNTIMGLDDSGSIITAITVDVEAGRIRTTAPDVGTRSIKNPSDSTLSPKATAFADAAKADLKAAVENSDNVPVGGASGVEKAYWTYACYQIYQDCSGVPRKFRTDC